MTITQGKVLRGEPGALPRTVPSRKAIRVGSFSLVYRPLAVSVCVALTAALFVLICLSVGRGDYPISIPDVISVLFGGGTKTQNLIVFDLRLPRSQIGRASCRERVL